MIDPGFLRLIVCPDSHRALREATGAELALVNAAIAGGKARNRAGTAVTAPLAAGLVVVDGSRLYPIQDGIPILLSAESISLPPPS